MLTLSLEKPGTAPNKLRLSLNKGARFTATVEWRCDASHGDDVDVHALEAANTGSGGKVTELGRILSTYNTRLMNPGGGALANAPDGSFETTSGGLQHSGDKRVQNNIESIVVDGSKLPAEVNEVPIFVTVHKATHGGGHEALGGPDEDEDEAGFGDIDECTIRLTDESGRELGAYRLSEEFKEFNVVQLGSLMRSDNGWEFAPVGRGFTGDFNDVLSHFS